MHELSVCQAIIAEVEAIASHNRARRVCDVYLSVGPLSGVETELLRNAFPFAAANTVAAEAMLHVVTTPVRVRCSLCDAESEVPANQLCCAECSSWKTRLVSGDELLLDRVEMQRDTLEEAYV